MFAGEYLLAFWVLSGLRVISETSGDLFLILDVVLIIIMIRYNVILTVLLFPYWLLVKA